jgi:hypothetical protein
VVSKAPAAKAKPAAKKAAPAKQTVDPATAAACLLQRLGRGSIGRAALRAVLKTTLRSAGGAIVPTVPVPFRLLQQWVLDDERGHYTELRGTPEHRWPFLVDATGKAATYLRYRDTNFLDAVDQQALRPEKLRPLLLGALRFGKPLAIDLRDTTLLPFVAAAFDAVQKGLWAAVLDGSVVEPSCYATLIRDGDGDLYKPHQFSPGTRAKMIILLVATAMTVDDATLKRFVVFEAKH